jgi:hypothetical protein
MNINKIIYSNNNSEYSKYSIDIKKFLLNLLIINEDISTKYIDCVNYFILINDQNFCDSLNDINICNILLNGLNDPYLSNLFNTNQIIISKSINIFNSNNTDNIDNIFNNQKYSLKNINLNCDVSEIKSKLIELNSEKLDISVGILDDIYNIIIHDNDKKKCIIFTRLYSKFNKIMKLNKNEVNRRLKRIITVIENIYKLVLNNNEQIDNIYNEHRENFINSIQIISIIKLKIDNLLKEHKKENQIDTKIETKIDYIDNLFKNNPKTINEILAIFRNCNNSDSESNDENTINSNILHIKNILKMYENILNIINLSNDTLNISKPELEIDINYIDGLLDEYSNLKSIENSFLENHIDNQISIFIDDIKEFISLNENCDEDDHNILIELNKLIIELISDIKNNQNINILNVRLNELEELEEFKGLDGLNEISSNNQCEISYLKKEINEIELFCNIELFESIQKIYNLNFKKDKINSNLLSILNLNDELELQLTDINYYTDEESYINIQKINEELIKEINKSKKTIEKIDFEIDRKKLI